MIKISTMVAVAIMTAAAAPTASMAFDFPGAPVGSLQEQWESAKFEEMKTHLETDDYFAGKFVELHLFGKTAYIDRRAQPPKPAAEPNMGLLNSVLDGIDAGARTQLEIDVSREWHEDGQLKSEKWKIVAGTSVLIKKPVEPPKKETGEGNGGPAS